MTKRKSMTKPQQDQMRDRLLGRQRYLTSAARSHSQGEEQDRGGDEVDQANSALNTDLALDVRSRESRELQLIDEALQKLSDGTYGVCDDCKQPIPLVRLEALPFAELCVDCQEKAEAEGAHADRMTDAYRNPD